MRPDSAKFKITIVYGCLALVMACAAPPKESGPGVYVVPSLSALPPEGYAREIKKYIAIIQSDPHANIQQQAHLYLASLYASPLNPDRNYALARKHLETYALFDPDFSNAVDPRILLAAVIEIERLTALADAQAGKMLQLSRELELLKLQLTDSEGKQDQVEKENLKLKKQIGQLQQQIRGLRASNIKLNKTIEMLTTLDSRLEEKRSNFIKMESTQAK